MKKISFSGYYIYMRTLVVSIFLCIPIWGTNIFVEKLNFFTADLHIGNGTSSVNSSFSVVTKLHSSIIERNFITREETFHLDQFNKIKGYIWIFQTNKAVSFLCWGLSSKDDNVKLAKKMNLWQGSCIDSKVNRYSNTLVRQEFARFRKVNIASFYYWKIPITNTINTQLKQKNLQKTLVISCNIYDKYLRDGKIFSLVENRIVRTTSCLPNTLYIHFRGSNIFYLYSKSNGTIK